MQASKGRAKERYDPADEYAWDPVTSHFKQKVPRYRDGAKAIASKKSTEVPQTPKGVRKCKCCSVLKGASAKESFKPLSSYGRYLLVDIGFQDKVSQGLKCAHCLYIFAVRSPSVGTLTSFVTSLR